MGETIHPPEANPEASGSTAELDTLRRERNEARRALRLLREQYALCTELARRQTMAMHELQQALSKKMQQPVEDMREPAPLPKAPPVLPQQTPQRSLLRRLTRTLRPEG